MTHLRPYAEEDRSAVLSMMEDFGDMFLEIDPYGFTRKGDRYAETLVDQMLSFSAADGSVLVAEVDGEVIGFAAGYARTTRETVEVKSRRNGSISELHVHRNFRRLGVGTALISALEQDLKDRGCETVKLDVFAPNIDALSFYAARGYAPRDITMMKVLTT